MRAKLLFLLCTSFVLACGGSSNSGDPQETPNLPSPTDAVATSTPENTPSPSATPAPAVSVDPRFNQPCKPGPDVSRFVVGENCRNLVIDGYPREFLVYVPEGLPPNKPSPLVFMLHGSSGNGRQFYENSGWRQVANQEKFVVVFPTSLEYWVTDRTEGGPPRWSTKWNDFTLPENIDVTKRLPGTAESAPWPTDDVAFVRAMIKAVSAGISVDPKRIYVAGFSNGGQFSSRIGVELSDLVAAVGASEGFFVEEHPAPRSTPILLTIGTIDDRFLAVFGVPKIPLEPAALMQIPQMKFIVASHTSSFGYDTAPCKTDARANVTTFTFCDKQPSNGTGELVVAVIEGLDHSFPIARNNDAGISGAREMWSFFTAHPLP